MEKIILTTLINWKYFKNLIKEKGFNKPFKSDGIIHRFVSDNNDSRIINWEHLMLSTVI